MTALELLSYLNLAFFMLLSVLTVVDFIRHRDAIRRDTALVFSVLSFPFWLQIFVLLFMPISIEVLTVLGALSVIAFIAQPYLQLRLVRYFRPLPRAVLPLALLGLILSSGLMYAFASVQPQPQIITVAIIAYIALVDGYTTLCFIQGAFTASGVVRQRLRYAAVGSGLLATTLLISALQSLMPGLQAITVWLAPVLAIISALSFYMGFAPPRWLRRIWQVGEFRGFLMETTRKQAAEHFSESEGYELLCVAALRAASGFACAVVKVDEAGHWKVAHASSDTLPTAVSNEEAGVFTKVWAEQRASAVRKAIGLNADEAQLLSTVGADTVLLVPIATAERKWGLLVVFLRQGVLFIEDDLSILRLLAQHTAVLLENGTLVEELRDYSQMLEGIVEARTLELRQREEQYRQIVETAQEGIWVMNAENRTALVNPKMADILGYSVDEMTGMPLSAFMDGNHQTLPIGKGDSQEDTPQHELQLCRKDGTVIWTLFSANPLPSPDNGYVGALATVVDISERKRAEEEIKALNTGLELRVAERTSQLSLLNKELEAFSYSVSHDLRAPLRSLDGFSQALLEDYGDTLDDRGKNFLNRIRTNSQRMGQLIDDMLQLSRLSRATMYIGEADLSRMAHEIEAELREQDPTRQIEVIIQEGLTVKGDARLLRIALFNLISNAWKYTRKQPQPRIEFGVTEYKGSPAFFVRDNGAGFDMEYADKLFGAFQRLHSASEFEGTGVGLAIVQRIIHRHNGEIWPEAAVNQGATFYFKL